MFDQKLLHLSNEVVKNTMLPNKKLRAKPGTPLDYIVNSVLPAEAELNTESLNQALSCVIDKSNAPSRDLKYSMSYWTKSMTNTSNPCVSS